jgi:hypothetical protein
LQDPVKVKLERDAKSASDDNRGADDQRAQDGPEAGEEDADGLGEIDTSLRVGGTETESVEDDALEVLRNVKCSPSNCSRDGS